MESLPDLATTHLLLRLQPINRALRAAVERQRVAAERVTRPDLIPLCVTPDHVQILLDQVGQRDTGTVEPALLTDAERNAEDKLRARGAATGVDLPLDRLTQTLQLTAFEQESLLLCVAPELDRTYERIYAFILDDLNRRSACVELLVSLTAASIEEQVRRRHIIAASGRLRRLHVLEAFGDPPTALRQELRLAPDVFALLTGASLDVSGVCRDEASIAVDTDIEPSPQIQAGEFAHLREALETRRVSVLGIWGPRRNGTEELALALASALQRPLRRVSAPEVEDGKHGLRHLTEQMRTASALGACLLLDTEEGVAHGTERTQRAVAEVFGHAAVPVFLIGEHPWRPKQLVQAGGYAEVELTEPAAEAREKLWARNLPELQSAEIANIAARYCLSSADVRCVSGLARTRARIASNGKADPVGNHIDAACSFVTRRSTTHFATAVQPRRQPDDLVLPTNLHQQILEVASFFRLRSRVDAEWGFGRLAGGGGMKALFTGDSGTGKTLAAEVIAGLLGLPLYKVDLARIVSKWVGETEKNLECAFREAEASHAVLFFDEADALFGKRGEVQHGTDRYANLEVSYLLQRLESSQGLVILASNLKDQIDVAFIRRFQIVVHFPRPGLLERRRIWSLAFPKAAPLHPEVDLDALARLDITGAGIMGSARTAALLAAGADSPNIGMAHVVRAIARQFRREARVLTPSELGSYGVLLQGVL